MTDSIEEEISKENIAAPGGIIEDKTPVREPEKDEGQQDVMADYTPPQSEEELMAAMEAILFAMGDSVEIADLAKALCQSERHIQEAAAKLEAGYEARHAGIMIQRFDSALQMSTTGSQYQNLIRIARVPKKLTLSDSVIETLSIIAYKQPITKAEIEDIRGVSSDYAINKLISYDLVKELGRKDAPGRPLLFGTTEQFLRSFGVKDLTELPGPDTVKTLEFKEEAEKEIDSRLGV